MVLFGLPFLFLSTHSMHQFLYVLFVWLLLMLLLLHVHDCTQLSAQSFIQFLYDFNPHTVPRGRNPHTGVWDCCTGHNSYLYCHLRN